MYLDRDAWPPPPPWQPPREPPRDRRGGAAVWIIVAVLFLTFLSPMAGATVIDAIIALVRG